MTKEEHDAKYPMCTKLSQVKEESQSIGRFLDWLREREDPLTLCAVDEDPASNQHYWPVALRIESLRAEYFEIDEDKLEEERRSMLEELRSGGPDGQAPPT